MMLDFTLTPPNKYRGDNPSAAKLKQWIVSVEHFFKARGDPPEVWVTKVAMYLEITQSIGINKRPR